MLDEDSAAHAAKDLVAFVDAAEVVTVIVAELPFNA